MIRVANLSNDRYFEIGRATVPYAYGKWAGAARPPPPPAGDSAVGARPVPNPRVILNEDRLRASSVFTSFSIDLSSVVAVHVCVTFQGVRADGQPLALRAGAYALSTAASAAQQARHCLPA